MMTVVACRPDDRKWGGPLRVILLVCIFLSLSLSMPVEAFHAKTNWARRVDLSEKIVLGEVIDVRSYWDFKKGLIYTDVTILVDKHIKGSGIQEITVTIPGGTIGDLTHLVSGTPQFAVGDYGVILLEPSGHVTGGPDGVYPLQKPTLETDPFQPLGEDEFSSWIKAYLNGQTEISFEEVTKETLPVTKNGITPATISGANPSTISAGTGNVLTISGSGFGASRGSGSLPTIAFRYKDYNYMYDNSAIKSWSDTQIQVEVWTGVVNNYNHSPGSWNNPNGTVAFVNSSGTFESNWPLAVSFGYGRAKWPVSTVSYYINATGGPSGSVSALQTAANTWSGAGASFTFNYAGTTTQGWGYDGYNVLSFADLGSSTIIAQAVSYISSGVVLESDIQFNSRFPFSTDPIPPGNNMDLESTAVHELGHWLRLLDLYGSNDAGKIMYGYGSYGQMKRSLTASDQSGIQWIYTGDDTSPPTPNPMTWATLPYAASGTSISMAATTATDSTSPPVSYYFNFTGSPSGGAGGSDSAWQSSTNFTNTGLQTNQQYGYRVKARDSVGNETGYSTPTRYIYTAIEGPIGINFGTVTSNSIQTQSINILSGLTRGNSGLMIENITNGATSGWKQNNDFWTSSSLSPNTSYSFRAKARNGDAIETVYSATSSKYSLANQPGAASFSNLTQTCIRANWAANGNPIGTEYFCENTTTVTNSGWTTNAYWDSCGLSSGTSYNFRVKARNREGVETVWTSLGSTTLNSPSSSPSPPTNMVASDGTYGDRVQVTWVASSGATSYTVYRSFIDLRLGLTPVAIGTTASTTFDDMTATPGTIYYYWVKATNAYGTSGFSSPDTGYRSVGQAPSPPASVSASDGTYADRVRVTWTASSGATLYEVWRNTGNNSGTAVLIASSVAGTSYDDVSAVAGTTYYYWVKAKNTYGTSGFSSPDTGYRTVGQAPSPPASVSASDGTYADRVRVTWTASSGATSYTVYRSPIDLKLGFTPVAIGTTTNTTFDDTTAYPWTTYYYWVKASNAYGTSGFSNYDEGYF